MSAEYSDSSAPLLTVDSASPTLSVAIGREGRALAERSAPSGRDAPSLLRLIDELLEETGLRLSDLGGAVAVRGPGSFTGLRVGLATLLGLHASLELPCTAIATFEPLAFQAGAGDVATVAVVDALRAEWFTQAYQSAIATEEPTLRTAEDLARLGSIRVIGFRLDELADALPEAEVVEARPLAPTLLEWATNRKIEWDVWLLTEPLYLRPPATTPPKRRGR